MAQLFGLSFDCVSFPSITIKKDIASRPEWMGIAYYSSDDGTATILKNIKIKHQSTLINVLHEKETFSSALYLGYLTMEEGRKSQKNAPPFTFPYGGRDWVMVHHGEIKQENKKNLFTKDAFFHPRGDTVSELAFCWLLEQIRIKQASRLADISWPTLQNLLRFINHDGITNILLSDGQDLVIYCDQNNFEPLYHIRSCPPHTTEEHYHCAEINITVDEIDMNHTMVLVSNQPIKKNNELTMLPGQMLVVRRGNYILDSHSTESKDQVQQLISKPSAITPEVTPHPSTPSISSVLKEIYFIPLHQKVSQLKKTLDLESMAYTSSATQDNNPCVYSIVHESIYHYKSLVYFSKHLFRLQPLHELTQSVIYYQLDLLVDGHPIAAKPCNFVGVFGNNATTCEINEPYTELRIISQSIVSLSENPLLKLDALHQNQSIPLIWMPWDRIMLQAYLVPPELPESELFELSDYAMSFVKRNNYDIIETLNDINRTIYRDFTYLSGSTSISTTPYELYVKRRGVCQDFSNLFICLARLLNIPARYRVGYVYTGANYENKIQSDATHAWVEIYLPYIGWIGFDPTNCCIPSKNHVKVACGRNYRDATPTCGTIYKGGGHETLTTSVKIIKIEPGTSLPQSMRQ